MSLCLYALIPAFLPLTKAPLEVTFCNSPHLSRRVGLHLFNVIESATFRFLQLREQEKVAWSKVRGVGRVWEGQNVVFCQEFICGDSPVSRSIVMVHVPNARATSQGDVGAQRRGGNVGLFVEFLIYRLASRDVPMKNEPVNVEKCNQRGLDIGLHLPCFLRLRRLCSFPLGGHLLCFRVIPINPAFVTSDYRGHEVRIVLSSLTEISAN